MKNKNKMMMIIIMMVVIVEMVEMEMKKNGKYFRYYLAHIEYGKTVNKNKNKNIKPKIEWRKKNIKLEYKN